MANPKKHKGDAGEAFACALLRSRGYTVVSRNYRTRFGEIDVIAQNEQYLLFAEVKARSAGARVSAQEAVDLRKQARLRAAAEAYLAAHPIALQPRFDVICLQLQQGAIVLDSWIENAF